MRSVAITLEGESAQEAAGLFHENDGEGVGLLAGGAAGAPDAQMLVGNFFRGRGEGWQDQTLQGGELRLIAEEAGFTDGDFVEQQMHFGGARGGAGEQLVILPEAGDVQLLHAAAAAVLQKCEAVIGVKDSGDPVDEIADLIGRSD